jgi:oligopeptide/dipeptide ABC transporter ATP-binding protein
VKPLLDIDGIVVNYRSAGREFAALQGFSLRIPPGETVAIVGESGCGKSTAFLAVMGLLPPVARVARGSIQFEGIDLASLSPQEMRAFRGRKMAMVFQDATAALNPYLTVGRQCAEVLEVHGIARGREAAARAVDMLAAVALPEPSICYNKYPHQLSGGQRQRAAIAMACVANPSLLIADEPTTALDPTVQMQILSLLLTLQRSRGMAIALVSHDLGAVAGLATRVAVVYAGRVVEEGPVAELYNSPRHPYTAALLRSSRIADTDGRLFTPVPGAPPAPGLGPAGACAFAPRCDRAAEDCRRAVPAEVVEGGRLIRCIHPLGARAT